MHSDRLTQLADVTRRYGRFRPCGAGLGVLWSGLILAALGAALLAWTRAEFAARALPSQTFWRFLRDMPLTPPLWLQIAALASPVVGWLGLLGIQAWVDRQFGAVTTADTGVCSRPRGPWWLAPFMVVLLAALMAGVLVWDAQLAALGGILGIAGIAAFALFWGHASRDQLTLLMMFALSVPSIYLMAATDPAGNMASGAVTIFGAYFFVMMWLLLQGVLRFSGFLKVRAELAAIQPVDE